MSKKKTKFPGRGKGSFGPGKAAEYIAGKIRGRPLTKEEKKVSPDRAQKTVRKSLKDAKAISARIKARHAKKKAEETLVADSKKDRGY